MEYSSCLKEILKGLLAVLKSFTTFLVFFINCCYCLGERLKTQSESTTYTSFVNSSNISDLTLAFTKPLEVGFAMWNWHY